MHHSAAVQTSFLGAEAARNAAAAEEDHDKGEHHDTDDDADKLSNAENQIDINITSSSKQIERGYKSCLYSRSLDSVMRSETGFEMNQKIDNSYELCSSYSCLRR